MRIKRLIEIKIIKNNLKSMKNKTKKILITIIIILLLPIFIYLLVDWRNLYVDIYNFWQLNKAKPYLETIDKNTKKFSNLKEFNEIYNAWIKPIKNCYSIDTYNWSEPYIFWFKLESLLYIYIYKTKYFAYPKYDTPISKFCDWWDECIDDINRKWFEEIISNPCKE